MTYDDFFEEDYFDKDGFWLCGCCECCGHDYDTCSWLNDDYN